MMFWRDYIPHIFLPTTAIVFLIIAIIFERKKTRTFFHNTLIPIIFSILSTIVIAIGFFIQPIFIRALHNGIFIALKGALELNRGFLLFYIADWLTLASFSGTLTGVIAASGRTLRQKIIRGSTTAIIGLIITDSVIFVSSSQANTLDFILFGMFSNMIGGAIAGVLIAIFIHNLIILFNSKRELSLLHIQKIFKTISVILLISSFLILSMYFFFVYRIPQRVVLAIEDWKEMSFIYKPSAHEVILQDKEVVNIPLIAKWVHSSTMDEYIDFEFTEYGHVDSVPIEVAFIKKDLDMTQVDLFRQIGFSNIPDEVDIIYRGEVPNGHFKITGDYFDLFIDVEPDQKIPNVDILVPHMKRILFSKEPSEELLNSFTFGTPPQKWLSIKTEQNDALWARLSTTSKIAIILIPKTGFHKTGSFQIELSGKQEPIVVRPSSLYPIVFLLGHNNENKNMFFYSPMYYFSFQNPTYELKSLESSLISGNVWVSDLYIKFQEGKVKVGTRQIPLGQDDDLFITGDRLQFKGGSNKSITVADYTPFITINGVQYSQSLWSSISSDIRAAIIVSAVTLGSVVIGWYLSKSYKRKRS